MLLPTTAQALPPEETGAAHPRASLLELLDRPVLILFALGWRAGVVVTLASLAAVAVNAVHPMGLPLILGDVPHSGIPRWVWDRVEVKSPAQAHDLWRQGGVLFLDVRDAEHYAQGHVPGALSLPYHEFTTAYPRMAPKLPGRGPILLYCYGSECGLAMRVAKMLLVRGYDNLLLLQDGIEGWQEARLEMTGPAPGQLPAAEAGQAPPPAPDAEAARWRKPR